MVFRLLAVLAEFERDLVSERTKTSLAYKRARSERTGQIPYSFDLDAAGPTDGRGRLVRLIPNPCEQQVIARIHALRSEGLSPRRIAAELNRLGIRTKTGRGPWIHTAVAKILQRKSNSPDDRAQGRA